MRIQEGQANYVFDGGRREWRIIVTEPYLKGDGIELYFDFEFIEYEEIPIVFVCHDHNNNLYICNCTETRWRQEWTVAKTDIETIRRLLEHDLSVYDALQANGEMKYLFDYDYSKGVYSAKVVAFKDIPETRLPEKGVPLRFIECGAEEEFEKLKQKLKV